MSIGTLYMSEDMTAAEREDLLAADTGPVARTRRMSQRERICEGITGCVEDLEADITEGRLMRAPDIARRLRLLRAELELLDARGFYGTFDV